MKLLDGYLRKIKSYGCIFFRNGTKIGFSGNGLLAYRGRFRHCRRGAVFVIIRLRQVDCVIHAFPRLLEQIGGCGFRTGFPNRSAFVHFRERQIDGIRARQASRVLGTRDGERDRPIYGHRFLRRGCERVKPLRSRYGEVHGTCLRTVFRYRARTDEHWNGFTTPHSRELSGGTWPYGIFERTCRRVRTPIHKRHPAIERLRLRDRRNSHFHYHARMTEFQ